MEKFLYFSNAGGEDASTDILCMPVSKFRGFKIPQGVTDAVSLHMKFDRLSEALTGGATDNEDFDAVDLVIASGTAKTVCRSIVEAINFGKDPFIVIADDTNSVYIDANITDVAGITIVE